MATGKEIKARIKSVKNTGKITKAMELISTVKMKKAQEGAQSARPFSVQAALLFQVLGDVSVADRETQSVRKELVLVIASNKGLCGGYNVNVLKAVASLVRNNPGVQYDFVAAGKRAMDFMNRTGQTTVGNFSDLLKDAITPQDAKQVSRFLQKLYTEGKYSAVRVIYSHFVSAINQKPVNKVLFPMNRSEIGEFLSEIGVKDQPASTDREYTFEPSKQAILETTLPMIYDLIVFEAFLEAKASEHASRMVAMKNAKDSANKKVKGLTLTFNKARQAAITKEVSEIVSGVESMKE